MSDVTPPETPQIQPYSLWLGTLITALLTASYGVSTRAESLADFREVTFYQSADVAWLVGAVVLGVVTLARPWRLLLQDQVRRRVGVAFLSIGLVPLGLWYGGVGAMLGRGAGWFVGVPVQLGLELPLTLIERVAGDGALGLAFVPGIAGMCRDAGAALGFVAGVLAFGPSAVRRVFGWRPGITVHWFIADLVMLPFVGFARRVRGLPQEPLSLELEAEE